MCEHDDFEEFARRAAVSRRQFGTLALGTGLAALLPSLATGAGAGDAEPAAPNTIGADITVNTPDGAADAYFVHPASGAHAAVLMWPDIFGLRPAFKGMATRLAGAGYAVLVVNPFYRSQKAPTAPEHADFNDPPTRDALMALAHSLSPATAATDARAFVDFLDGQAAVDTKRKVGTLGYCMSGPIAIRTAAARAERIGAVATFHGGGLVTKDADSPHLLIAQTHARYLVAIAASDDARDPDARRVLRASFDQAQLRAEVEVYAGTQHGWCPTDSHVYDHDQAEKAWSRLLALFGEGLA
ncbi:MAG TPA: dienelactone hydrolase family protein [Steroidobacteraceae bacterium]|nr:dienelactone hydrolase family protein [Steroidobacteraceae bacterium]